MKLIECLQKLPATMQMRNHDTKDVLAVEQLLQRCVSNHDEDYQLGTIVSNYGRTSKVSIISVRYSFVHFSEL